MWIGLFDYRNTPVLEVELKHATTETLLKHVDYVKE